MARSWRSSSPRANRPPSRRLSACFRGNTREKGFPEISAGISIAACAARAEAAGRDFHGAISLGPDGTVGKIHFAVTAGKELRVLTPGVTATVYHGRITRFTVKGVASVPN